MRASTRERDWITMVNISRATSGSMTLALSGLLVMGFQAPASAHHADGHTGGQRMKCDQRGDARYPPGQCTSEHVGASQTTVEVGQGFRFHGEGFAPGTSITITLYSKPVVLGTTKADRFTFFEASVTIPVGTPAGEHRLVASGTGVDGAPFAVGTAITVVASGVVPPADVPEAGGTAVEPGTRGLIPGVGLPRTGPEVAVVAAIGAVLVAVGGTILAANRRRWIT